MCYRYPSWFIGCFVNAKAHQEDEDILEKLKRKLEGYVPARSIQSDSET